MSTDSEKYRSTVNLNVREGPTTASRLLGSLAVDDVVEKIGES